jgi:hypothetical protein
MRIVGRHSQKRPSAGRRKDLSIGTLENSYHSALFPLQKSKLALNYHILFVYIHRAKLFFQLLSAWAKVFGNPLHPLLSLINEKSSKCEDHWYTIVYSAPHGISNFSERKVERQDHHIQYPGSRVFILLPGATPVSSNVAFYY